MLTVDRYALTSSSLIKQVATMGGDVSSMVPQRVAEKLKEKISSMKQEKRASFQENDAS